MERTKDKDQIVSIVIVGQNGCKLHQKQSYFQGSLALSEAWTSYYLGYRYLSHPLKCK